jgi:hypothetical protein
MDLVYCFNSEINSEPAPKNVHLRQLRDNLFRLMALSPGAAPAKGRGRAD